MSAQPVYRTVRPQKRRVSRARVIAQKRAAARRKAVSTAVGYAFLFLLVAATTFTFSTLIGHSMMENARLDSVRATSRARAAKAEVASLRNRIESLSNMKAIEDWAKSRGFLAPYQVAPVKQQAAAAKPSRKTKPVMLDMTVARVEAHDTVR